jgi:hypothetical protein
MLSNHIYNLMLQLVEEHKALWRIKKMYKKDAGRCPKCRAFWSKLEKDKESHIKELQTLIKSHLK